MCLGQMASKLPPRRKAVFICHRVTAAAMSLPPSVSLAGFGPSYSRSQSSLRHVAPRGPPCEFTSVIASFPAHFQIYLAVVSFPDQTFRAPPAASLVPLPLQDFYLAAASSTSWGCVDSGLVVGKNIDY